MEHDWKAVKDDPPTLTQGKLIVMLANVEEVLLIYDATWGNGRGGWFNRKGHAVALSGMWRLPTSKELHTWNDAR